MEKVAKCSHCGKDRKLVGRGLCCACYHRDRRKRLAGAIAAPQEDFIVSVDFSPMAFILEELRKRAGGELRELGSQVLWELNKSLGAGTC